MKPFWYLRRRPDVVRDEVDEELRVHLEMRVDELRSRGLPAEDARREAIRQFGDLDGTREYCRRQDLVKEDRVQRSLMLQDLAQDVRIGFRNLVRSRMLTLTVLLTVGLGIGATTAIFAAVNAALLQPLPYADPERLVRIYTDAPPNRFPFSVVDFQALQAQQTQFEQVGGYASRTMAFSDGTTAERLRGREVTWTYFSLLGLTPEIGRDFTESDSRPGSARAVIVSRGFWERRLGSRPDAIGTTLRLDGAAYTIAGVLPATTGPLEHGREFFTVAQWEPPRRKGPFFITALGRVKHGAEASAAGELRAINARLFPIWKTSYQDDRASWSMMPLRSHVVGDVGRTGAIALAAVALVWLIAGANASSLLVARVTGRRRELAVRAALGASRGRVVRYLLAESSVLAIGSAAVGLALAWAGVALLRTAGASYFPRMEEVAIDGPVLALLAALTGMSGLLFGLVPAVHGTGGPVDEALRAAGRSSTGGPAVRRLRRVLVGSQFAIATPLLIGAALLIGSLDELRKVDLGFDGRNLLTGGILLPSSQYPEPGQVVSFWDELERRIEALPGVAAVAFSDGRPPNDINNFNNFDLEQFPTPPGRSQPVTPWLDVTPDYFRLLGIALVQGRMLDDRDARAENVEAVLVDRAWARRFFPHESAIGKRFKEGGCTTCPWTVVVGIVSDVKYAGLDKPDEGSVYTAMSPGSRARNLVVRTATDPAAVLPAIRQTLKQMDPSLPLSDVATIDDLVARALERPTSLSLLIAAFAIVALILSSVGIYGVMAYFVEQHAKDISIRLALGGSRRDVLRLVVGQAMAVVATGLAAGVLIALAVTPWMSALLFGVSARDGFTFAAASSFLVAIALLACAVPARRATALEPAAVLRDE